MKTAYLLDTGPLVAYLDRRDRFHAWAKAHFDRLQAPFLTCEAVITEACYLLRSSPRGPQIVLETILREAVSLPFRFEGEAAAIGELMARYANVPMSFADACLVRMSEVIPATVVLTLDRDFTIYRKHHRQDIPLLMPTR